MKLSDFILLNVDEKKCILLHDGVLIGKRTMEDNIVFLFQLENYYVESYCSTESRSVEEYRAFTDVKPLHPYIEAISLDDLLNHG